MPFDLDQITKLVGYLVLRFAYLALMLAGISDVEHNDVYRFLLIITTIVTAGVSLFTCKRAVDYVVATKTIFGAWFMFSSLVLFASGLYTANFSERLCSGCEGFWCTPTLSEPCVDPTRKWGLVASITAFFAIAAESINLYVVRETEKKR
ncbi:hypothetical protein DdX_20323 [Ditylenchus destructor]|uniref:Uncharacterized protein n=1 Tax=Ditylenchus destructor TaxID=166010 RepID=A0AAD4MGT9_9BILA|nr:hypothetical protein DdX_20323 [Ditylenchus destructor]